MRCNLSQYDGTCWLYRTTHYVGQWVVLYNQQNICTAARFDVSSGRNTPLSAGLKLEEFDKNEPAGGWSFRGLVGLMWLANQTRTDIADAVRAVARYANQPREVHWRTAIGILEYVFSTSNFGSTF